MITPFDRLVYTAARFADEPMWRQFLDMFKALPMKVCGWPEQRLSEDMQVLKATDEHAHIWEELTPYFVLYTNHGLTPDRAYRPVLSNACNGGAHDVNHYKVHWELPAFLVFQQADWAFDVIPIMDCNVNDIIYPELQLSFTPTGDGGWTWEPASTGFINGLAYGTTLAALSPQRRRILAQDVEWLGNTILYCLGTYAEHLKTDGDWMEHGPKPARIKRRKDGSVRKIHTIAQAGWFEYTPR